MVAVLPASGVGQGVFDGGAPAELDVACRGELASAKSLRTRSETW